MQVRSMADYHLHHRPDPHLSLTSIILTEMGFWILLFSVLFINDKFQHITTGQFKLQ